MTVGEGGALTARTRPGPRLIPCPVSHATDLSPQVQGIRVQPPGSLELCHMPSHNLDVSGSRA